MFFYTDTADAPWVIVKSNDKKRARLNCMRHFLSTIDYPSGVEVAFHAADILTWDWSADPVDAVLAVFIQFLAPPDRARVFAGFRSALCPGGLLLLHGYAPRQVDYGTGGPPHRENMYTLPILKAAFADFDILETRDYDAVISEGAGHNGLSGLVDFVARKPDDTMGRTA
jgi:hypothetical protein